MRLTVNLTHQACLNQVIWELVTLTSLDIPYLIVLVEEMRQRLRWLPKDIPWGTGKKLQNFCLLIFKKELGLRYLI